MILREATKSDIDDVFQVFTQAVKVTAASYYSQQQIDAWASSINDVEKWQKRIKNDYFVVASKDEKIVGFASLKSQNYVDLLFVHPSFGRQKIGTKLLQRVMSKRSADQELTTHASHISKPLFRRHDFQLVCTNQVEVAGVKMENFEMRKTFD